MLPTFHDVHILKEPQNHVLRIICVCSLFCSVQVYISLHFFYLFLWKISFSVFEREFDSICTAYRVLHYIKKDMLSERF